MSIITPIKNGLINLVTRAISFITTGHTSIDDPLMETQFCNPSSSFTFFNPFTHPVVVVSSLLIVISILFGVLVYFISLIINAKRLKGFAKQEIVEAGISFILLLLTVGLLKVPCWVKISVDGTSVSSYALAYYYLQLNNMYNLWSVLPVALASAIVDLASMKVNVFGVSGAPLGILLDPFKYAISNFAIASIIAYIINSALIYSYDIVTYGFLMYLLPIGFLLRSFFFTRKIGGAIIGVVISMNLIFPMVLSGMFFVTYTFKPIGVDLDFSTLPPHIRYHPLQYVSDIASLFDPFLNAVSSIPQHPYTGPFRVAVSIPKVIFLLIAKYLGYVCVFSVVASFFLPAVLTVVTTTGARVITGALGHEIDISNLTRLI